ncbi:MAG: response regulator [Candidatus Altiarchaeota archaeon]
MSGRILLVDDEPEFRDIYSKVLKSNGFEVTNAENGIDCINKLRRNDFDIVLIDLLMPLMSGMETIRSIKNDKTLKDTRIVVMSVLNMDERSNEHLKELGVENILVKPIESWILLHVIKKIMEKQ